MAVSALVIDDGELQDVRGILEELGVEYRWLRAEPAQGARCESPSRVFVTTARRALQVAALDGEASSRPVRMAVLDQESKTVCQQLRERGFDYVVRRPVHPIALQLLLLRALYRGEERRVSARVAIGCRTSFRTSFRPRPALLADLSRRGCRFYAARALELDTELRLQLPKDLCGDEVVELTGWVVRCEREALGSAELPYCVGVAFDLLPDAIDGRLRAALEARAAGPEPLAAADAGTRRSPRRPFRSRVSAVLQRDRGLRTLVGRNISAGGMLLDPEPGLDVGDRLAIALFGAPGQRLEVRARVVRSEPDEALALAFDPMPATLAGELEALIGRREPADVEAEGRSDTAAVVGEITRRGRGTSGC